MKQTIQSEAFNQAALRSEQYRIYGILFIVGGFMLLNIFRTITYEHTARDIQRFCVYISFWIIVGGYEFLMLTITRRAERRRRPVRTWIWTLNTIIECCLPSVAVLGQTGDKSYLGPYLALASGILLLYAFFIILSTLRLSPAMSILAGVVSSAGYMSMYLFTLWVAPKNPNRNIYRPEMFINTALLLLGAGFLAAAVARQIRRHLIAALAEAETRRKLDRVEHDLQIARTIQMGLLPKSPPTISGYDIAGWSEPADQTGGDYYDWMELPGGKVMFTIADATGHGIGPALLVAACRAYFRAIASHDDPLERITQQVDALLAADIPDGRFITAAIALLEPEQNRLSLYSAGHAPLYLYVAAKNEVLTFDADQPPLGIRMGFSDSQARVIPLAPGDSLVLVTDGFFECHNHAGDLLGIERLGEAIRQHQSLAGDQLIRRLYEDVLAFSQGEPQEDDLTAVVIKRKAC